MKNKGFTLIELLAVIVILAIIALIATPIILNIISDSKEESNKRSVELYGKAVEQAIAKSQLNGNEIPAGDYTKTDVKTLTKDNISFEVQYSGSEVTCTTNKLYEDGSIYLAGCTVNGTAVDYTYGEQQITQVYKPQYYGDWSGTVGTTAAPSNPSSVPPTDKNYYLGYDVEDGKVSAAYVCFKREGNDTEYCLKGYDTEAYATNTEVLEEAFGASACSFGGGSSSCDSDGLRVDASSYGAVYAFVGSAYCNVSGGGTFACDE